MNANTPTAVDLECESHVWLAWPDAVTEATRLDQYRTLLSTDECARLDRFHFDVHKKLYLVSHALVRTTLSHYADIGPREWVFCEGEFGRPEIAASCKAPPLRFNLSHTEGLAALVVSMDRDCGVDVERLHRVEDLVGVAERVFTQRECDDLLPREGDDREGRFADYWTLKEAYMKARGKGFQLPPHTFGVRLESNDETRAALDLSEHFDDDAAAWQLSLQAIPESGSLGKTTDYRLAVALREPSNSPHAIVVRNSTSG